MAVCLPKTLVAVLAVAALIRVTPAFAQAPDPANVRVRIGPLMMNPTVSLTNIGIDQNVFNEPASKNPKHDFTFTVKPTTDFWLPIGPTWVTASLNEAITWYQQYASERSASNDYKVGWVVPGSRLSLKTSAAFLSVKERPGFEIDTRASRKDRAYNGSFEVRALSKTFFGVSVGRLTTRFDSNAMYLDTNLELELNHSTTDVGLNLRHQLTPLTSITLTASRSQDQFEFSTLRDSTATAVSTTVAFDKFALVKGSMTFGFTDFEPVDKALPNFQGATAAVNLSYTLLGTTRFAVTANRNVQYSYDVNQPYYVITGLDGSIAQQIFGPVDVVGRVGTESLAYRDRAGAVVQVANRNDHVLSYGLGVGFHMGKDLRLSFNADKVNRDSLVIDHQYDNVKFGTAITYGF
jgi:hypothetical protein